VVVELIMSLATTSLILLYTDSLLD